jgi:hypothetical protein
MTGQISDLNRREWMCAAIGGAAVLNVPSLAFGKSTFHFDANRVPFSCYGSYLAISNHFWPFGISAEVPANQFYIRCLQDDPAPPEVFRIELLKNGVSLPAEPDGRSLGCATAAVRHQARRRSKVPCKGTRVGAYEYILSEGLDLAGQPMLSAKIREGFCNACLKGGMSEHFDARTGVPQGDPSYIWTAAMYLYLNQQRKS